MSRSLRWRLTSAALLSAGIVLAPPPRGRSRPGSRSSCWKRPRSASRRRRPEGRHRDLPEDPEPRGRAPRRGRQGAPAPRPVLREARPRRGAQGLRAPRPRVRRPAGGGEAGAGAAGGAGRARHGHAGAAGLGRPARRSPWRPHPGWPLPDLPGLAEREPGGPRSHHRPETDADEQQGSLEFALLSVPSPDGRHVAYLVQQGPIFDLRIVGMDGSNPRVLYSNENWPTLPDRLVPRRQSVLAVLAAGTGRARSPWSPWRMGPCAS